MSKTQGAQAVIALFNSAQELVDAIPKVRATWHGKLEAYTPYPVHGIEKLLGIKTSWVGWIVLGMGLTGLCFGFGLQTWIFNFAYPLEFGGKPHFGWPAFIPVTFETTVLFSAFGAVFGMLLVANRFPHLSHPFLKTEAMKGITRDRFALVCEAPRGGSVDEAEARAVLEAAGGQDLEVVYETDEIGSGELLPIKGVLLVLLICVGAGFGMREVIRWFPVLPPMVNLDNTFRQNAQGQNAVFKDGFGMRTPVVGTVARGFLPDLITDNETAGLYKVNPVRSTMESMTRGKALYENYCLVCHGPVADGKGLIGPNYGGLPANLHSQRVREIGDGYIWSVITHGRNTMGAYGKDIADTDRWHIVNYVRALQRAQDAPDEDLILAKYPPAPVVPMKLELRTNQPAETETTPAQETHP
ncbi:MAG: DUF3341 domain-containing protein [Candidatus Delongbacteria bacterium]|nr:DUF3341 domain-containing protein [Candidatus Delongbacteria bacterium]